MNACVGLAAYHKQPGVCFRTRTTELAAAVVHARHFPVLACVCAGQRFAGCVVRAVCAGSTHSCSPCCLPLCTSLVPGTPQLSATAEWAHVWQAHVAGIDVIHSWATCPVAGGGPFWSRRGVASCVLRPLICKGPLCARAHPIQRMNTHCADLHCAGGVRAAWEGAPSVVPEAGRAAGSLSVCVPCFAQQKQ